MTSDKMKKIDWKPIMFDALKESFIRLNPILMLRNIVMFVVEIGAFITTAITIFNIVDRQPFSFNLNISLWLWFTVIFSNFAEAIAESRGKAQTEALKSSRSTLTARKISEKSTVENPGKRYRPGPES